MKRHFFKGGTNCNEHKKHKIEKVKRQGREPYAEKLYEDLTEEQAYVREWCLINVFFGRLTNIDESYGTGFTHTKRTRKIISRKMKGENNPMYGKSRNLSKEHKQKIREAQEGTTLTEEHIQKLTGREFSEEHRQNMAEAKKGEKNPEAKLNRKEAAEIKWLNENTSLYQYEIAENYNIDQALVSKISREKNWRNVTSRKP